MRRYLTHIGLISLVVVLPIVRAAGQDDVRSLFEAGKYQAVIEKTGADSAPSSQYVRGLASLKVGQPDQAKDAFRRLEQGDGAWKPVGQSAVALVDGNQDAALDAAKAAVAQNAALAEAQYQLGRVLEARGERASAADAFVKAAEANPQMAYAHYNAAMNFYEAKQVARMAVYFENFLKLAPNAPERPAVESIMRTVRGR